MHGIHDPQLRTPTAEPEPEELGLRPFEVRWIVAFWTFMALLTAANRLLGPLAPGVEPPQPLAALALAFCESYLWAALTPLVFRLSRGFGLDRSRLVPRLLLFLGVGLVVAVAVDVADDFLRIVVFRIPRLGNLEFQPLQGVSRFWFLNELITYLAILAAGFARDYSVRYRRRQEEAVRLQAQAARLQAQLSETRLSALRTQLNPHFLFNTLHAVSALVERDPEGVRRMLARLSELLRHTLEGAHAQEVTLEEELGFVERSLEIMRIRFHDRLEVDVRADPEVLDALVPNLILQPLVENAIKHGMDEADGVGRIRIRAHRQADSLILSVRDEGPAASSPGPVHGGAPRGTASSPEARSGNGVGLRNTRARLSQLYADAQSLTLRGGEGGGLVVEIVLPYHTRADLRTAGVGLPP